MFVVMEDVVVLPEVGIALYSAMIMVVSFLGGFVMVLGSRVLSDISVECGSLEGMVEYVERSGKRKDVVGRKLLVKVKRDWKRSRNFLVMVSLSVLMSVLVLLVFLGGVGVEGWEDGLLFAGVIFGISVVDILFFMNGMMVGLDRVVRENRSNEMLIELRGARLTLKLSEGGYTKADGSIEGLEIMDGLSNE